MSSFSRVPKTDDIRARVTRLCYSPPLTLTTAKHYSFLVAGCDGRGSLDRVHSVGRRSRGQRRRHAAVGSNEETSPCGVSTARRHRWRRLRRRRRRSDRAGEWTRVAATTGKTFKNRKKKTMIGNENSSWSEDRHRKMETYGYLLLSHTMFVPMKQLYVNHCDEPVCKFYKKCFFIIIMHRYERDSSYGKQNTAIVVPLDDFL